MMTTRPFARHGARALMMALLLAMGLSPEVSLAAVKKSDGFWHDLRWRSYDYYIPDNAPANAPVVLAFHGITSDSTKLFADPSNPADLPALADEKGFIVVWTQATTFMNSWNGGPCCAPATLWKVDDVGYTLKVIERLRSRLPRNMAIDDARIYAIGHSNGASMVHRLGLQRSDVFSAIVPISFPVINNFSWRIPGSWVQYRNMPVLALHATDDNVVPYDGVGGLGFLWGWIPVSNNFLDTAQEGLATWASRNRCVGSPQTTVTNTGFGKYQTQLYPDCAQGVSVGLHTFYQGKHRPWYPEVNGGLDVVRESWRFLSRYHH